MGMTAPMPSLSAMPTLPAGHRRPVEKAAYTQGAGHEVLAVGRGAAIGAGTEWSPRWGRQCRTDRGHGDRHCSCVEGEVISISNTLPSGASESWTYRWSSGSWKLIKYSFDACQGPASIGAKGSGTEIAAKGPCIN